MDLKTARCRRLMALLANVCRGQSLHWTASGRCHVAAATHVSAAPDAAEAVIACLAARPARFQPCSALRGVEWPAADAGWGWAGAAAGGEMGLLALSTLVWVAAAGPLAARYVNTPSSWSHMSSVENTNWSICTASTAPC